MVHHTDKGETHMKKSDILEQATHQAYQAAYLTGDLSTAHRIKTAGDALRKADDEGQPEQT